MTLQDYLLLRCDAFDLFDDAVFRRSLSPSQAASAAYEALRSPLRPPPLVWSILLAILALRHPSALADFHDKLALVRSFDPSPLALPPPALDFLASDLRRLPAP